jgi:putative hydrolase of the HAD superfamily
MTIKAVLFDLDDTLLWDDRSINEAFRVTAEHASLKYGVDALAFEDRVRQEARDLYATFETFAFTKMIGINPFEGLWGQFRKGEQTEFRKLESLAPYYRRESWCRALRAFGIEDDGFGEQLGEQFASERRKRPYVYEETFQILIELKKKNFKLLLLTNGSPDLQQEKIDGVPELASFFDYIVVSGVFGEGKPAVSIFEYAASLLGIAPEEGLMVGDKLTTDILGSNRYGMPNAWINRHGLQRNDEIEPVFEIKNLLELHDIIQKLNLELV